MEIFDIFLKRQPVGKIYIHMLQVMVDAKFRPTGIVIKSGVYESIIKSLKVSDGIELKSNIHETKADKAIKVKSGIEISSGGDPFQNILTDDGQKLLTRSGDEIMQYNRERDRKLTMHEIKRLFKIPNSMIIGTPAIGVNVTSVKSLKVSDGIELNSNNINTKKTISLYKLKQGVVLSGEVSSHSEKWIGLIRNALYTDSGGYPFQNITTDDDQNLVTRAGDEIVQNKKHPLPVTEVKRLFEIPNKIILDSSIKTTIISFMSKIKNGIEIKTEADSHADKYLKIKTGLEISSGSDPFQNITTNDGEDLATRDGDLIVQNNIDRSLMIHADKVMPKIEDEEIEFSSSSNITEVKDIGKVEDTIIMESPNEIDTIVDKYVKVDDGIEIDGSVKTLTLKSAELEDSGLVIDSDPDVTAIKSISIASPLLINSAVNFSMGRLRKIYELEDMTVVSSASISLQDAYYIEL